MAFLYSAKFKNAVLDTSPLKTVFQGTAANEGYIVVYSGAVPVDVNAALDFGASGNKVLAIYGDDTTNTEGVSIGGNFTGVASGNGLVLAATATAGGITKSGAQTWQARGLNTGEASFFRYERSPSHIDKNAGVAVGGAQDDGTLDSGTLWYRIQGIVGGAGADLIVQNNTYTAGVNYTLQFFSIAVPVA